MIVCAICNDDLEQDEDGEWWHVNESNDEEEAGHAPEPEEVDE